METLWLTPRICSGEGLFEIYSIHPSRSESLTSKSSKHQWYSWFPLHYINQRYDQVTRSLPKEKHLSGCITEYREPLLFVFRKCDMGAINLPCASFILFPLHNSCIILERYTVVHLRRDIVYCSWKWKCRILLKKYIALDTLVVHIDLFNTFSTVNFTLKWA